MTYDPARHGGVRVGSGENAEARVAGTVDGYNRNPPEPDQWVTEEAQEVYRQAYLEHLPEDGQLGLFSSSQTAAQPRDSGRKRAGDEGGPWSFEHSSGYFHKACASCGHTFARGEKYVHNRIDPLQSLCLRCWPIGPAAGKETAC